MEEDTLYNILIAISVIGIVSVLILIFTTKTTESFTELYFEDHQNLPSLYATDDYEFAFTIHNLENQEMVYSYQVSIEYYDNEKLIDTNLLSESNVLLQHNESATITEEFKITEDHDYAKVMIQANEQEIHFWLRSEE
jgi:uncharacterized membrane protein